MYKTNINGVFMKTSIDCIPCLVRMIISSVKQFIPDDSKREKTIKELLKILADQDFRQSPPMLTAHIQRKLLNIIGSSDPFEEMRRLSNDMALELEPILINQIANSNDPFQTAVRIAIAGNIIDFGIKGDVKADELKECLYTSLRIDIDEEALNVMRKRIENAKSILYLCDNSGEIVFDKILIKQLKHANITVAIKGYPILNDAVISDAEQSGLTAITKVITNGSDYLGTVLDDCSDEFKDAFSKADLIISKGQANYETLADVDHTITFLFMVKCLIIANRTGIAENSFAIINK